MICWHCNETGQDAELTNPELLTAYCGSCHLTPDPAQLPHDIWRDNVLPEMAARLGFRYGGYQPMKGLSMEEEYDLIARGIYPAAPLIDSADWWSLHDYILSLAPDSLERNGLDTMAYPPLDGFAARTIPWPDGQAGRVTGLNFDAGSGHFRVGSAEGATFYWPAPVESNVDSFRYTHPVTADFRRGGYRYVTEVGRIEPNEATLGVVHRFGPEGEHDTLVTGLQRAVDTQVEDLNGDGRPELIVCEFGYRTGRLSLFTESAGGEREGRTLYEGPGSIRTQVADLNDDGRPDIIALVAQGAESVIAFYQTADFTFRKEVLVRQPAVFGSSWFELFDYEGDGDLDLAIANGDNADHSNVLKPYHGLRLFLNDGRAAFTESFFFPLDGCTHVIAQDLDGDGDTDFALTAYFADWHPRPVKWFCLLGKSRRHPPSPFSRE